MRARAPLGPPPETPIARTDKFKLVWLSPAGLAEQLRDPAPCTVCFFGPPPWFHNLS